MFRYYTRGYLGGSWILLVLLTFLASDVTSARSPLLLAVCAIVPPLMMLALWHDRPPFTRAAVPHTVEERL